MKFIAIDVETANADYSSICQIEIAEFKDGRVIDTWSTLINPEAYFDGFNISIHGITEEDVKDAPAFDQIYNELSKRVTGQITVHHMPFDRIAINRACVEYNLDVLQPRWLDSAKIARRTWEEFAYAGYGLANIAGFLKIEFKHHDALEDAIAAGKIVHQACEKTEMSVEAWCERVRQPIFGSSTIKFDGNPEGPLYGENLVFTGTLFLPRREAGKIAAELGCNVGNSVNKKTTMLVVGMQNASRLGGYEKSSKHRKTEELIKKGIPITVLSEKDFVEMCYSEDETLKLSVLQAFDSREITKKKQAAIKESEEEMAFEMKLYKEEFEKIAADILNKAWGSLTDEQKAALYKADREREELIKTIKDCTHEEKRTLAKVFKSYLEKIELYHQQFNIESFEDDEIEDDEIEVIYTIDCEISQLQDSLYDLMKNKTSLGEFFGSLSDSIESIADDLEEATVPKPVKEYVDLTLKELQKIKKKIILLSSKG